ncbi:MAG: Gfo/Idh/MocA family protein, partial [Alphaproteobacteria bacterium]
IIVNLTIPDAHFSITRDALQAGKHAYSEKPLALSMADGQALADLANEVGRRVGSAPDTFLGGAHQQARAYLDSGAIGAVVAGSCHVMSHGMEHWHPNPDFFFLPGGGPVLDVGPYYFANLIHLIGPARRVAALTSSAAQERTITNGPRNGETVPVKTPTNIHALMEFANGATVTVSASWDIWSHEHTNMELYGKEGTLFVPDPNFFGGTVRTAGRDGAITALEPSDHPCGVPNQQHNEGMMANYRAVGLADMAAAIGEGREHRCSLERTLHGLEMMLAILQSGETGEFVDLTTTCTRPEAFDAAAAAALLREPA